MLNCAVFASPFVTHHASTEECDGGGSWRADVLPQVQVQYKNTSVGPTHAVPARVFLKCVPQKAPLGGFKGPG